MPFGCQTVYHSNSELLICYSRHTFDEQTVLEHLNTKLVCYSDPPL